jgi:hypothetical protein
MLVIDEKLELLPIVAFPTTSEEVPAPPAPIVTVYATPNVRLRAGSAAPPPPVVSPVTEFL